MSTDETTQIQAKIRDVSTAGRKWLGEARSFWKTRRAIRSGERLWDLNSTQVRDRGVLGAWQFSAFQTAFAGTMSLSVETVLEAVFPITARPEFIRGSSNAILNASLEVVTGWITPFVLPVFLSAAVFVVG